MKQHYAFVQYEDHESAVKAIEGMDKTTFINGEYLHVVQSSMYSLFSILVND